MSFPACPPTTCIPRNSKNTTLIHLSLKISKNLPFIVCLTGIWGTKQDTYNGKMFGIQTQADKYDDAVKMMKIVTKNLEQEYKKKIR